MECKCRRNIGSVLEVFPIQSISEKQVFHSKYFQYNGFFFFNKHWHYIGSIEIMVQYFTNIIMPLGIFAVFTCKTIKWVQVTQILLVLFFRSEWNTLYGNNTCMSY